MWKGFSVQELPLALLSLRLRNSEEQFMISEQTKPQLKYSFIAFKKNGEPSILIKKWKNNNSNNFHQNSKIQRFMSVDKTPP